MRLALKSIIPILIYFTVTVNCKSHIFTGNSWNNELRKCASGGEEYRSYNFFIGDLNSADLEYSGLNSTTKVIASGVLKGHTGAVDNHTPDITLSEYQASRGYKKYHGTWGYEAVAGWAKQRVRIQLTVIFRSNGKVELNNYVYAASWMAVTCAETTAYVKKIEVITE